MRKQPTTIYQHTPNAKGMKMGLKTVYTTKLPRLGKEIRIWGSPEAIRQGKPSAGLFGANLIAYWTVTQEIAF